MTGVQTCALPISTATDAAGNQSALSAAVSLVVNTNPAIFSFPTTRFAEGVAGSFPVIASAFPAPTFSIVGQLPTGLSINSATGVISGTPSAGTAGKSFQFEVVVANGVGSDARQLFSITVLGDINPAERQGQFQSVQMGTGSRFPNRQAFAVIKADGTVAAWGDPAKGGNAPSGLTDVVEIFSTKGAFAALRRDGTVVAWGDSASGGSGVPVGLSRVKTIYSTASAFLALKDDGTVVGWGDSARGGTPPANLAGVIAVCSNTESFAALKSDGTVSAWGRNFNQTITPPNGLNNVVRLFSTNEGYCALRKDGTVATWGGYGGNAPVGLSNVVDVVSNYGAFSALKADGSVVSWGGSQFGGSAPAGLSGVVSLHSSDGAMTALRADGSVVSWGDSTRGGVAPTLSAGIVAVYSTSSAFAGLLSDGTVLTWGNAYYGGAAPSGLSDLKAISSTWGAFAALKADGTVVAWGDAGNGGSAPSNLANVVEIHSTYGAFAALKADGTVVSWGNANQGGSGGPGAGKVVAFGSPIEHAPRFTVADKAVFNQYGGQSFQVVARGIPETITLSLVGNLPTGLTFDPATGIFSGTPAAGTDGSYSVTVSATSSRAASTLSYAITVDLNSPSAPVVSAWGDDTGALGDGITSDTTIALAGLAESGSKVQILDGQVVIGTVMAAADGAWSFTTPALADGDHSITVTATDAAGNVSVPSAVVALKVDSVAPQAPVIGSFSDDTGAPGDGITSDTTITLSGTGEAGEIGRAHV